MSKNREVVVIVCTLFLKHKVANMYAHTFQKTQMI